MFQSIWTILREPMLILANILYLEIIKLDWKAYYLVIFFKLQKDDLCLPYMHFLPDREQILYTSETRVD
jgi:hypothetical protein